MRLRRCLGWTLSATLSLSFGSVLAAPEECLSYKDNPHVAACANQYGPGSTGGRSRATAALAPAPARPATQSVLVGANSELRTVAVRPGGKPAPTPEPPPQTFLVDRAALTDTVIAGALGGCLLVVVALGFWRWGSKLKKTCPYCGWKMARAAHSCRHCFRAV